MASLINIKQGRQQAYNDIEDVEGIIHSTPDTHQVDAYFPIIAKGNRIEGIEAK